ncbi:NAD(P)/FAD-dependent oxidoreductase [Roseateles amylovorans]|uniref:NAD(P)-binding protein n=1 Tax=Roseateles amylovorans TaxID=2978473 RepID=A0ABY6B290_9BURK|nr:NAD(P)-binding protein [Roseateles amylovorans]UXH77405.1 NAD(P)-binding protein [Roseateles amylovorans]
MLKDKSASVAVVGAGVAGASCAQALMRAGQAVQVFDKARGAGGRLATRRLEWPLTDGDVGRARLDHGAVGFTARSEAFRTFVSQAQAAGCVAEWTPQLASDSLPLEDGASLFLPTPDMPAWSKHLLAGAGTHWSFAVDRLERDGPTWRLCAGDVTHPAAFDAVVLAVPAAQAAPLLNRHHEDWARFASLIPMQPCWTLMGVAHEDAAASSAVRPWALARPELGPLAWVIRNDRRPGRVAVDGQAHWVAHARPGWSRLHLERDAEWVQQQLSTALEAYLGESVRWAHAVVHRWRYALPPATGHGAGPSAQHWWDDRLGLGVCGDLFGSTGVEGAVLSAQSLAKAMSDTAADAALRPPQAA